MGFLSRRHGERVEIGGIAVRLAVNPHARRVSIRIDRVRREAIAVAPTEGRLPHAIAFARERRAWLADRLADLPPPVSLTAGDSLVVVGAARRLVADGRRPRLTSDELRGCGAGEVDAQLVARAIRRAAGEMAAQHVAQHCAALGVAAPRIVITDARSRWGSCAPGRRGAPATIRLSWRLALAPLAIADYVAAHEACHLLEANHGPRFWALVRRLVGDERASRRWLRVQGASLHAF